MYKMDSVAGFISAPIKLAALINNKTKERKGSGSSLLATGVSSPRVISSHGAQLGRVMEKDRKTQENERRIIISTNKNKNNNRNLHYDRLVPMLLLLIVSIASQVTQAATNDKTNSNINNNLRHQTHYLNIVPSTHFNYHEGRQFSAAEAETHDQLHLISSQPRSMESSADHELTDTMEVKRASQQQVDQQPQLQQQHQPMSNSHIYKRSSALISSSIMTQQQPRISGYYGQFVPPQASNPSLRRRMMSEINTSNSIINSRWSGASPSAQAAGGGDLSLEPTSGAFNNENNESGEQLISSSSNLAPKQASNTIRHLTHEQQQSQDEQDLVLLRQKQHIQYHDQLLSSASSSSSSSSSSSGSSGGSSGAMPIGRCHKRTLNFCASVLPFNTTTFPNIIGDTNRFEVKRSLPFFGFLAKSSCNKRLDELLCLLLEPPCSAQSGNAIPPCKKFCRLALEGCNEYIPATLALSSVFDCRQYPDSSDPNVCINLAQGSKCAQDEFKCPDKTCIPRE